MTERAFKGPDRRRLLLIGLLFLVAASGVAANGILRRSQAKQAAQAWTTEHAVPTVALAAIEHGSATRPLTLPATIQPFYRASIYARVDGYLDKWYKDIGAEVKQGQVLASIDAPDLDQQLMQAKGALASAQAAAALAKVTAQRWQALGGTNAVARQAVDEKTGDLSVKEANATAAQANVDRLEALSQFKRITAPFDGVVTARNTDIGALITAGSAGQPLFEVSDLHRVRIYVRVPQALTAYIKVGQSASFDLPQYPGQQFAATVTTASGAMDAMSRSMLVELQADNADRRLSAGAYCRVHFDLPPNPKMMRLPSTAIVTGNNGAQVAVVGANGKVKLKPVKLGHDFGDSVEVLSGLNPSDRIANSPPETIRNGDVVKVSSSDASH
jgi:RND family efflux transporter MFP subunit